ncbi:MAG: NAD(+) synthase [Victivallaceae bacterium]|nr:NAD(+) synthase [Victivallaceae bacterium]
MFGFYRLAAAVPELRVADPDFNAEKIVELWKQAGSQGVDAVVFPELAVTGYSCRDLFFQERLHNAAHNAAARLIAATAGSRAVMVFGMPLRYGEALYNTAFVAQNGKLMGIVPKTLLPNYREFYEKRQFKSGRDLCGIEYEFDGEKVPFGVDLVFEAGRGFCFGVEICEDMWGVLPPSSYLALAGARAIFNLSAGTELAAKAAYRRELVAQQSARCLSAYVLASAGVHESTTDAVFSGHAIIAENGRVDVENTRFDRAGSLITADIDFERLGAARLSESSFNDNHLPEGLAFRRVRIDEVAGSPDFSYAVNPQRPFVPESAPDRDARCAEIFAIQCAGLAKRVEHTHAGKLVLGISGGLDSTLALLVSTECCRLLGRPDSDVVCVTMPGFGTSGRTYRNAVALCRKQGVTLREIDIRKACFTHFADIGHDPAELDVTYENVQARERTKIMMDLANKLGGIVVGTGDLSEIALGWSTYNGDHMSMYAVNSSVPKTLIRFLIDNVASRSDKELAALLRDVIDTPVSPELLPADSSGDVAQKTEELVGPYELHDYFLYHFLKYGADPDKLAALARHAFAGRFDGATVDRWLKVFLQRFFRQQFKRSCMPDGPKVGTIALSPRGDWRMPSDASCAAWLEKR